MTTAEKIQKKGELLANYVASFRHIARHNGAKLRSNATVDEVAAHIAEIDPERVALLWRDINTIDRLRSMLRTFPNYFDIEQHTLPIALIRPEGMTTADLQNLPVNDPGLAVSSYTMGDGIPARRDWAVLRITKSGTEILSYGGGFYQGYPMVITYEEVTEEVADPETGEVTPQTTTLSHSVYEQSGETELLRKALEAENAAWLSQTYSVDLDGSQRVYSESGTDFYVLPCDLPSDIEQLLSLRIARSGDAAPLAYTLNDESCSFGNEGMIDLPHGIYLIYDNSTLQSAPKGLLVPKALADGADAGIRWSRLEISYNAIASGLDRLRLVSDAFGDELIISTQDDDIFQAAWSEDAIPEKTENFTLIDVIKLSKDYKRIKDAAAAAGVAIDGVKYVKDLVAVLQDNITDELAEAAGDLLADADTVAELRKALAAAAGLGGMFTAIDIPTDKVKEGDLNA